MDDVKVGQIWQNNSSKMIRTIVTFDPKTKLFWFADGNRPMTNDQVRAYHTMTTTPAVAKKKVARKKVSPNVAKADKTSKG